MSTETPRRRGRPRREGADQEILSVALELLRAHGYRDFNVDDVAERTGIAKTTIYRRWPSKGALVAAAIAPLVPAGSATSAEIVRETAAVLSLLAGSGGEALDAIREIVAPRRESLKAALGGGAQAARRADAMIGTLLVQLIMGDELCNPEALVV